MLRMIAAVLLVGSAASAAANVLVVRSSGPSAKLYPPGKSLADNARITLGAGDILTLLGSDRTRTFRGPGTYSPNAPAAAPTQTAMSSLRRTRIGAMREREDGPVNPDLWQADITQSGKMCLAPGKSFRLWRPDAGEAARLSIAPPQGAAHQESWPANQASLQWPAAVPVTQQGEYQLRVDGQAEPVRLTFVTIKEAPAARDALAKVLIDNGCQNQLDLLIDTMPADAP